MKRGAMLINTSRGAVVDTRAVIRALKSGHLGSLGLGVYEQEGDLFFRDPSDEVLHDDVFARVLTFPNVVVTGHHALFTEDALTAIAQTTLPNLDTFEADGRADSSRFGAGPVWSMRASSREPAAARAPGRSPRLSRFGCLPAAGSRCGAARADSVPASKVSSLAGPPIHTAGHQETLGRSDSCRFACR